MPKFTVYRSRLLAIPGTRRELRIPGRKVTIHEDYRVEMTVVGVVTAIDAEVAVALAKIRGYIAPIIGPWKEPKQ